MKKTRSLKKARKLTIVCTVLLTFALIFSMTGAVFAQSEPSSEEPRVMFNGKYLDFTTAPVFSQGQLMVSLDECRNLISQIQGKPISIAAPAPTGLLQSSPIVSLRTICDQLGYSLSWDSYEETAVIIDFKSMFAAIDADYTILNKLMQLTYDPDETYLSTSDTTASMKMNLADSSIEGAVSADIKSTSEMLNQKMNMSGSVKLNLNYDLSQISGDITAQDLAEIQAMLAPFENIEIKMIFNADEEVFYLNPGALGTMLAQTLYIDGLDNNTWLKADFTNLIDQSGYDEFIRLFLAGDTSQLTLGTLLQMILDHSDMYSVGDYEDICIVFDVVKELLSDKAFTVSGPWQQPTYELTLNAAALQNAMLTIAKKHPTLIGEALSGDMSLDALSTFDNYNMTFRFTIKGPHTYDASMTYSYDMTLADIPSIYAAPDAGDFAVSEDSGLKMQMNMDSQFPGQTTTDMTYHYKLAMGSDAMTMNLVMKDVSVTSVTTTQTVQTAPPPNAKVLDVMSLLGL